MVGMGIKQLLILSHGVVDLILARTLAHLVAQGFCIGGDKKQSSQVEDEA